MPSVQRPKSPPAARVDRAAKPETPSPAGPTGAQRSGGPEPKRARSGPVLAAAQLEQTGPNLVAQRLREFKNILIDVRGDRGGNGDVAAGYLTARDMLTRLKYDRPITLLVTEQGARVLAKMLDEPVKGGTVFWGGKIHIHTYASLPQGFPTTDLYLSMAAQMGKLAHERSFRKEGEPADGVKKIPVSDRTVMVAEPVFGNTENWDQSRPNALVRVGGKDFEVKHPGLSAEEGGIYYDAVALSLREKSPEELRQFISSNIGQHNTLSTRKALKDLYDQKSLAGAERGLVYGIGTVQGQFTTYLKGLVEEAQEQNKSFAIVTPSRFSPTSLPPELKDKVAHFKVSTPGVELPKVAEPGKVYVVEVDTLEHELFVGLMADSRVPPIVSGDGAMSAAISLGKPFVMTVVGHNQKNVEGYRQRLTQNATPEQQALLQKLMGAPVGSFGWSAELSDALELRGNEYEELFRSTAKQLGSVTDHLVGSIHDVLRFVDGKLPADKLDEVKDEALRQSLKKHAAAPAPQQ